MSHDVSLHEIPLQKVFYSLKNAEGRHKFGYAQQSIKSRSRSEPDQKMTLSVGDRMS